MRPTHFLIILLLALACVCSGLYLFTNQAKARQNAATEVITITTSGLGITDLCIATEARYTRHPAISDRAVPFMDHPGAIEHFPSGSFWAPPPQR